MYRAAAVRYLDRRRKNEKAARRRNQDLALQAINASWVLLPLETPKEERLAWCQEWIEQHS